MTSLSYGSLYASAIIITTWALSYISFNAIMVQGLVTVPIVSFCAGGQHSCEVFNDKKIKCRGYGTGYGSSVTYGDSPNEVGDSLPFLNLSPSPAAMKVSCGSLTTCVILDSNELKCLGSNDVGQVGIGSSSGGPIGQASGHVGNLLPVVNVGTGVNALDIAVGYKHSCVKVTGNKVKCFGYNASGQLGYGDTTNRGTSSSQMGDNLLFLDLGTNVEISQIITGSNSNHNCVILSNPTLDAGRIKCWGEAGNYQLGYGDQVKRGDGSGEMGDDLPLIDLGTESKVNQLSVGGFHTCALLINDILKCWGNGAYGQLASGDTIDISTTGNSIPDVTVDSGKTVTFISTGLEHTCVVYDDTLTLKCLGNNQYGELGQGDTSTRGDLSTTIAPNIPAVQLGTGSLHIADIKSGMHFTCVRFTDSSIKCFGQNDDGQLGIGSIKNVGDGPYEMGNSLRFTQLFGPVTAAPTMSPTVLTTQPIASACLGESFSCFVLQSGSMKCAGDSTRWGKTDDNSAEDIGDSIGEIGDNLPEVDFASTPSATKVSCGQNHLCIILSGGSLKCMGSNFNGQAGLGVTDTPIGDINGYAGNTLPVVNVGTSLLVLGIATGGSHTCVKVTGNLAKCFGANGSGQLGYEDTVGRGTDGGDMGNSLAYVSLGTNVEVGSIISGSMSDHNCVILSAPVNDVDKIKCWGRNDYAQLGYGDTDNRGDGSGEMGNNLPLIDLGTESRVKQVALGSSHTCGILFNDVLKCWGDGGSGQLNSGDTQTISSTGNSLPVFAVDSGKTVKYISAGSSLTCIVYDDETTLKCVGLGSSGQLGQGDISQKGDSPTTITTTFPGVDLGTGSLHIASIITGSASTCVVFVDDSVKCIGQNNHGQFANGIMLNMGDEPEDLGLGLKFTVLFSPTAHPTTSPTASPSKTPTATPTKNPTNSPTNAPSKAPTATPTKNPTDSPTPPTSSPTNSPSKTPSNAPSKTPTISPTKAPSKDPTVRPTQTPTKDPTLPTYSPTNTPSNTPTRKPTSVPTIKPTYSPSTTPTSAPTKSPTVNYCVESTIAGLANSENATRQLSCDFYDTNVPRALPIALFNLTTLKHLDLIGSGLIGVIPTEIGALTSLETLSIINTNLNGSIAAHIGNLTNLVTLRIESNPFLVGIIPTEIGNLKQLKELQFISNSGIYGTIPKEIIELTSLTSIQIIKNKGITGTIPSFGGNSINLIDLSDNNLSGTVPSSLTSVFSKNGNENILDLRSNQLTGSFEVFSNPLNINKIYLSNNKLAGNFPNNKKEEGYDINLLDISNNFFSGVFPDIWDSTHMSNLKSLSISSNKFTSLPDSFFNENNTLKFLELSDNPWRCNCKFITALSNYVEEKNILNDRSKTICGPTNQYSGIVIPNVRHDQRSPCNSPENVAVDSVTVESALLTWDYDNTNVFSWPYPDVNFEVQCDYTTYAGNSRALHSTSQIAPWNRNQPITTVYKISQLKPYGSYKCKVVPFYYWYPDIVLREGVDMLISNVKNPDDAEKRAINQKELDSKVAIYGAGSVYVTFQTLSAAPESSPDGLRSVSVDRRAFTVAWDVPNVPNSHPDNMTYEIQVYVRSTVNQFTFLKTVSTSDLSLTVTGDIKPRTVYRVTVKGKNVHGMYPKASQPLQVQTKDPCPPGTYENGDVCTFCEVGFYNEKENDICKPCPSNSQTTATTGATSINDCIAQVGFFADKTKALVQCPPQANCTAKGVTIENLPIKEGYWRSSNDTLTIYECIHHDYCVGSVQKSRRLDTSVTDATEFDPDQYCFDGHNGVLCESCEGDMKIVFLNQGCKECENKDLAREKTSLALLFVLVPLFVMFLGLLLSYLSLYIESRQDGKMKVEVVSSKKKKSNLELLWKGLSALIPILQMIGILLAQFKSAYPNSVIETTQVMSALSLNFSFSIRFPCLFPSISPQHMNILVNLIGPFVILAVVGFTRRLVDYLGEKYKKKMENINVLFLNLWIRIFHFVYTGICATLIREFHCSDFGNGLIAITSDVTTYCTTDIYRSWSAFTAFVCVFFIPGIPIYLLYNLFKIRAYIRLESEYNAEMEKQGHSSIVLHTPMKAKTFNQIYHNYKWHMYWNEPVQMFYGVFLTTLLPLALHNVAKATIGEQMVLVMLALLAMVVFLLTFKPYRKKYMNEVAVSGQVLLVCVVFIGILYQADVIVGDSQRDKDAIFFGAMNAAIWIGSIFIALWPLYAEVLLPDYIEPWLNKHLLKIVEKKDETSEKGAVVLAVPAGTQLD